MCLELFNFVRNKQPPGHKVMNGEDGVYTQNLEA